MIFPQILLLALVLTKSQQLSLPFDFKNVLSGIYKPRPPPQDSKDPDKILSIASGGPVDVIEMFICKNGCFKSTRGKCTCPTAVKTFVDYDEDKRKTPQDKRTTPQDKRTTPQDKHTTQHEYAYQNRTSGFVVSSEIPNNFSNRSPGTTLGKTVTTTQLPSTSLIISKQTESQSSERIDLGSPLAISSSSGGQMRLYLTKRVVYFGILFFIMYTCR